MFEREENPCNVTSAKVVVGLASYKEADSIAFPTEQSSLGLKKYYGDETSAILNCDNHSPDDTEGAFMGTETEVPKIHVTTPPDTPGKGYNFENMFRKILELDTEVLVCLDADLLSVTPEWIKHFVEPIKDGYDFVNPIYSRHKYDGTITNNICYPIVYGLFCRNTRQPIGGDFALSRRFAKHVICQPWHRTTQEYGIDIFLTMNSIVGDFKTCCTGLGAKVHKPSAPKLGPMFTQVVSTAFQTVVRSFDKWKDNDVILEQKLYGLQEMDPPQDLDVDRAGGLKHQSQLEKVLSPGIYRELTTMFSGVNVDITAEQWVTIVYDMIAYFKKTRNRNRLIESLKGLYFGRTLAFMNKTWDWSSEKAEEEILAQAELFHKNRGYLVKKLEALDG